MAVKIRLTRLGDKKAPFYRVVVADSRSPRDGRFIDNIGTYNPLTDPAEIKIDVEKANVQFQRLQEIVLELRTLKDKIQKLEDYFD